MKYIIKHLKSDKLSLIGLCLIIISAIIFASGVRTEGTALFSGAFMVNYILSGGYFLSVVIHNFRKWRWRWSLGRTHHTILMLILYFISAFSLNREMNVFDDSVTWLCVWVVLSSFVFLISGWQQYITGRGRHLLFFLLGSALLLFTYYAFYLLPLYIISMAGLIALGISIHTYIPMFMAIMIIHILLKANRAEARVLRYAVAGFTIPLMVACAFVIVWAQNTGQINNIINRNTLTDGKLPAWVAVSKEMPADFMTERMMKAGLVYHEVGGTSSMFFGGIPSTSFNERRRHDPLVVIATLFTSDINLDDQEKIKVLRSLYNSRHQAQERLWNGDNLQSISVASNVKIWPEYRMAYTEKTLNIRNNSPYSWSAQEAVYTFHLSEASVVSSLSLWINGKEEKSRLTTKAKADTAYNQIVGVEQHDPSVVHWQEGNTVSVRVFPCDPNANRQFRIGITSPLRYSGKRLVYENPWFEGPEATSASEFLKLDLGGNPHGLEVPSHFSQAGPGMYTAGRSYHPEWQLSFDAPAIQSTSFSFAGNAYKMREHRPALATFIPKAIYLDVNKAWERDEFDQILTAASSLPVYVYNDKIIQVTPQNSDLLYGILSKQQFSLFPLNAVKDAANALLVTKSNGVSPNLSDLDESGFGQSLTRFLQSATAIRTVNIGNASGGYIKALHEFRALNIVDGSVGKVKDIVQQHRFEETGENDSTVVIPGSGVAIERISGSADTTGKAPDHLLRLFAYNDLMKRIGGDYFKQNMVKPENIAEAEQAYIVSPVSSMIVLETQKDYERFGIDENKNSLKNASMNSSGAVPEPHEWMLIILALGVVVYLFSKQGLSAFSN